LCRYVSFIDATLGEISDVMRSVFGTHQGKATV